MIHRNAEERADLVKAFRAAKRHLSKDRHEHGRERKSEYICWALEFAEVGGKITLEQRIAARALIRQRLDGCATLSEWMSVTHPALLDATYLDSKRGGKKMQQTRLAWLDSLIAEFSQPA